MNHFGICPRALGIFRGLLHLSDKAERAVRLCLYQTVTLIPSTFLKVLSIRSETEKA